MNSLTKTAVITWLATTSFTVPSLADFEYVGPTQAAISGQEKFAQQIITGKGRFPLAVALSAIAGENVILDLGDDLDKNQIVKWHGGRTRAEILDELFANLDATWRYDPGKLIVRSAREIELAKRFGGTVSGPNVSVKVIWKFAAGETFRKVVHEWCRSAGCVPSFETPGDLQFEFGGELQGTFQTALHELVLAANRQGWPLDDPEEYDNGVIVFKERGR